VVGMRIGQENVFGINEWKNAHFNGFLSACFFILIFTVMLISILWLLIFGNSSANPVYIKKTLAEPLSAGGGNLNYKPNFVPVIERTLNAFAAFILLVYGSYGIYTNDLYIPRMRSGGIHLHDTSALVMYSAIICACSVMISVVVDHYDKGNNEHKYKSFARFFKYLGWGLFGGALALHIVGGVYA